MLQMLYVAISCWVDTPSDLYLQFKKSTKIKYWYLRNLCSDVMMHLYVPATKSWTELIQNISVM